MAKKKKVVIVDEELTPTVLATIDTKKSSILGMIGLVFLVIFFAIVIYFLPNITLYIEEFKNSGSTTATTPKIKEKQPTEEELIEITKYPFADALTIEEEKFTLSNFKIEENKLSILMTNKINGILDMDKYHYYLEIYNEQETLLQRIKVDNISIGSKASEELQYELIDTNINYFIFMEIPEEEYPTYTAPASNLGEATLTCTKDNERINYVLQDNKVHTIEDYFDVKADDVNYATLLSIYQSNVEKNNALEGVTSEIKTSEGGFTYSTLIDLSVNNKVEIANIIYAKDTDAKVIHFELSARGYVCN